MKIIDGLSYYEKLDTTIQSCIQEAAYHPFEDYIFISEDKYMVEQLFFKHTNCLVNIQVMSWNQFIHYIYTTLRLTQHHKVSDVELYYLLFKILNENHYQCFPSPDFALIQKLIPVFKNFDLYETSYNTSNQKLYELLSIYQKLQDLLGPYKHLSLESLIAETSFNLPIHLYIEGDHLTQPVSQKIISSFKDVTILYTYTNDQRLCNLPFQLLCQDATHYQQTNYLAQYLYSNQTPQSQSKQQCFTFIATTPLQEVTRVVYTIKQMIVDQNLHYKDFAIIYPDESYVDLLLRVLKDTPHSLIHSSSPVYQSTYRTILKKIDSLKEGSLNDYVMQLKKHIQDHVYLSYFDTIEDFDISLSPQQFKEFFQYTYNHHPSNQLNIEDMITISSIDEYKTPHAKHAFFLGLNDTIMPRLYKDRNLLLDEDIHLVRQLQTTTPPTTLEQYSLHLNNILKSLSQPAFSMTFSYATSTLSGNTYTPSSLYKELNKLFTLTPLPPLQYIPIDELYLSGGQLSSKNQLNKAIHNYITTQNQPINPPPHLIQQLYSPTLSVSQIETYNKCPFLYFIQYGLQIKTIPEHKILPNEFGSLVHHILSLDFNHELDLNQIVKDYILSHQTLLDKVKNNYFNQYCIEQLIKDTQTTIKVIQSFQSTSQFKTYSQEEKVKYTINNIPFKGFIDRIDTFEDYLAIIDYKSSSKDIDLNLALQGFNIQMLLYLYMATQTLNKKPAAVLYFNFKKRIISNDQTINTPINIDKFLSQYKYGGYVIDDHLDVIEAFEEAPTIKCKTLPINYVKSKQSYKGHLLNSIQLETLTQHIIEYMSDLYQNMTQGYIAIKPKGSSNSSIHPLVNPCSYCPYQSICHFDVFYNEHEEVKFYDIETILGGDNDAI